METTKKRTVNISKDVNGKNIRIGRMVSINNADDRGMRSALWTVKDIIHEGEYDTLKLLPRHAMGKAEPVFVRSNEVTSVGIAPKAQDRDGRYLLPGDKVAMLSEDGIELSDEDMNDVVRTLDTVNYHGNIISSDGEQLESKRIRLITDDQFRTPKSDKVLKKYKTSFRVIRTGVLSL